MKKIFIGMTVLTSISSFAVTGNKLPNPAGTLKDAKVEKCSWDSANKTIKKYENEIFKIKGVDGIGHEILNENENQFGVRCTAIYIYADMNFKASIQKALGTTLDGHFIIIGESGGPGIAQ